MSAEKERASNVEIITGNNHQISKKEVPTQVMESDVVLLDKSKQAFEVSDTPMITKRPETYTEALLSNLDNVGSTHSDEFGTRDENNNQKGGVTNHCMEKEGIADSVKESHSQPPSYSDVGFKGVDRRRNRIKHFFLSGISEDVSESQIKSYLSKRNVIPKYLSVFQSRRRGSISAKVSVPSSAIPLLQDENFWPGHVKCKPWRKNPMKNATYV